MVDKGCPIVLGGPLPHVMAAKAIAFKEANTPGFVQYAHQIVANAQALAGALISQGVKITTGGTENHLFVMDVASTFRLTGRQAEMALREAGLTVNRNAIPFDVNGPWYTSGVRMGTPALTTLGMKEAQMQKIAQMILALLRATTPVAESRAKVHIDPKVLAHVKGEVAELLGAFPLYPELCIH